MARTKKKDLNTIGKEGGKLIGGYEKIELKTKLSDHMRQLINMYPEDEKMNFYMAYMYFKYTSTLVYRLAEAYGVASPKYPPKELDPSLETFFQGYMESVKNLSTSRDTIPYASKVVTLDDATQLVTVQEDIELRNLSTVIPFKQANNIVMHNPKSIAIGKCACRLAMGINCEPMGKGLADEKGIECCFFIGDPWASIIDEENPRFRKCSQEEAVHVLKTCHEFGSVQMAYWRKELNRDFYCICNCCKCDCIPITGHNLSQGAIPVVAGSGYKAKVRLDACVGCGICIDTCNFLAMTLDEEAEKVIVDLKKCMGCGICKTKCPENAVTLVRDPTEFEPLDLKVLRAKYGH